jgi:hypothetical protein
LIFSGVGVYINTSLPQLQAGISNRIAGTSP